MRVQGRGGENFRPGARIDAGGGKGYHAAWRAIQSGGLMKEENTPRVPAADPAVERGPKTLKEIAEILEGEILNEGDRRDEKVTLAGASDLMSDVLAFMHTGSLLLTGLKNPQVVRTAEMADLCGVVFVRGKHPDEETLSLAKTKGLPLLKSRFTMFESCGRLYLSGLKPCF